MSHLGAVSMSFFFQAEDGIRDLVRSRGLGDVYKRQLLVAIIAASIANVPEPHIGFINGETLSHLVA